MANNLCVVCEEDEGSVLIAHLIGFGTNVKVCSGCYTDCEPVNEYGDE